ncbi:MAG: phosphate ABC transporter permease subunit PstC, partial [Terriglobia bacterium]
MHRLKSGDEIAHLITLLFALSILLITVLIVYELYAKSSLPRHRFGWAFLITRTWDPVFGHFGALTFIYGTVVTSVIALVIAIPLG